MDMDRDQTLPATPAGTPTPTRATDESTHRALVGQLVAGRYRVEALLGAGGMGAVYTAQDESLRREVALKVVRPALAQDATVVARLVREAQAVAALNHPAIVTVHDAGFRGEVPFIVMEKLAGESLDRRLARGAMSPEAAVRMAVRLLEALAAAHDKGIVHRDIKPANVFLCAPDESPKLLDFGVAAVAPSHARPGEDAAKLTEAGTGVGTPLYMAPEQVNGAEPTARADLYAVGAVLYEALSGRAPFAARTLPELYAQKITAQPAPVRERAPGVPPALADVIDACLQRDPDKRPAHARALRESLLAALGLAGAPAPVTSSTPKGIAAPDPATGDTMAVSAGGGLALTPRAVEIPAARASLVETRLAPGGLRAGRTRWTAILVLAAAVGAWRGLHRLGDRGRAPVARALTAAAASTVSAPTTPSVAPLIEPRAGLRTMDEYHDASGASRALLNTPDVWDLSANDLSRAAAQPTAPLRWKSAQAAAEGKAHALRGEFQLAIESYRHAIELEETWAVPHTMLAEPLANLGNTAEAVREVHRAEELEPGWWLAPSVLGNVYAVAGQTEEAIQAYRRARAVAPREPSVLDGLALALHAAGLDSESERVATEALALDPDLVWCRVLRAERALERHDGNAALEDATRAVSVSPRTAAAHLARGDALALLHRAGEARDSYQTALRLLDESHQAGLPADRIGAVRAALAHNRVPTPRGAYQGNATRTRTRAAPSGGRSHAPDAMDMMGE